MIVPVWIRRWIRACLRISDILDLFANIALVIIAVESIEIPAGLFHVPTIILVCGGGYILATVVRFILIVRSRKQRDVEFRNTVCQLFHWFYKEMFSNASGRRFTLFAVDPLDSIHIIPKVRYSPGHPELNAELYSRARYRSGEGCTGHAWDNAGQLVLMVLPNFSNRDEFVNYYANTIKIARNVIEGLSDYMVKVRGIYSYGFHDHRGALLGVLSIDVQGEPESLDCDEAAKLIRALGPVLEAFAS